MLTIQKLYECAMAIANYSLCINIFIPKEGERDKIYVSESNVSLE